MMLSLSKRNVLSLVAGMAILGVAAPGALAQGGKPGRADQPAAAQPGKQDKEHKEKSEKGKEEKKTAAAKVGELAPAFELKDTEGKTVKLSDYKGKVVVLDWFNPDCPVCAMHYKANTIQNLAKTFADKDVVFLAVNSGAPGKQGHGVERNSSAKKDWSVAFPILMDESGKVGQAYGAKTTPHCYVIDKAGTLVYAGAIDDGNPGKIGKTNYVESAVNAVLKGETVSPAETKPFGCSVKYGAKS